MVILMSAISAIPQDILECAEIRWGDRIQEIHLHYAPDDLEQPEGVHHPLRRRYDENLRSSCSPDKRRAGKSIRIAGNVLL